MFRLFYDTAKSAANMLNIIHGSAGLPADRLLLAPKPSKPRSSSEPGPSTQYDGKQAETPEKSAAPPEPPKKPPATGGASRKRRIDDDNDDDFVPRKESKAATPAAATRQKSKVFRPSKTVLRSKPDAQRVEAYTEVLRHAVRRVDAPEELVRRALGLAEGEKILCLSRARRQALTAAQENPTLMIQVKKEMTNSSGIAKTKALLQCAMSNFLCNSDLGTTQDAKRWCSYFLEDVNDVDTAKEMFVLFKNMDDAAKKTAAEQFLRK